MTYTTAIVLNVVFAVLVLAGLARIVSLGFRPERQEARPATSQRDGRLAERVAA
jgi:hypothetical protein